MNTTTQTTHASIDHAAIAAESALNFVIPKPLDEVTPGYAWQCRCNARSRKAWRSKGKARFHARLHLTEKHRRVATH